MHRLASRSSGWGIRDSYRFISSFLARRRGTVTTRSLPRRLPLGRLRYPTTTITCSLQSRLFHDYFVQALPPSSQHPDRREKQLARIPLRSAKHHFGVFTSRGERGYNEDAWQAGVVNIAPFGEGNDGSKCLPRESVIVSPPVGTATAGNASASLPSAATGAGTAAGSTKDEASGGKRTALESNASHPEANSNPVFYFGIYDGHGGDACAKFLQGYFHDYLEMTANEFGLVPSPPGKAKFLSKNERLTLQNTLTDSWRSLVGGYFRRFKPDFDTAHDVHGRPLEKVKPRNIQMDQPPTMENLLFYSFLRADFDFVTGEGLAAPPKLEAAIDDAIDIQAHQQALEDMNQSYLTPIVPSQEVHASAIKGGSTASVLMVSMPPEQVNAIPFWHPSAFPTLISGHVGDTRILLCHTATGEPHSMTTNHHPNLPSEAKRLRRYAASFVTDSFGEERFGVLANTRSFGDIRQKRLGVSAEPEMAKLTFQHKGEYAFLVLVTDGVSGTLSDQEIVDTVKDSATPEQAAKTLVNFAVEVTKEGDNATAIVVRLGGWDQRGSGEATRELRQWKKKEAEEVRTRRM